MSTVFDPIAAARRRRRMIFAVAAGGGILLFVLTGTAVQLAYRRVQGTEGLIAQQNMLVGIVQAFLALVIALSTVYYALRTGDMVEAMQADHSADREREFDGVVSNLIAAALAATSAAAMVVGLMRRSWRWYLPGSWRPREQLLMSYTTQLTTHLTSALRWSEELIHVRPDLRTPAQVVVNAALQAHDDAMAGRVDLATRDAADLRAATDALRVAAQAGATQLVHLPH